MIRRSSAFTLVEVLVWMAVLALFLSMMTMVTVSGLDGARSARRALERAETVIAVCDRIGADVRSSTAIVSEGGGRKSGPATLILECPGQGRVTYLYSGDKLIREVKGPQSAHSTPLALPVVCEFLYDSNGPAQSSWVEVRSGSGKNLRVARFSLMSAEGAP